ncbi:MAG: hypothetical protein M0Q51_01855 [Bacteroidales bacterium]|nr:hypothetical protein [Bacteroidales bacterium]
MKLKPLTFYLLLLSFCFAAMTAWSQCEPASPEQCPDPENNGQVCPDSLTVARIGQLYSQVATIKPPAIYLMEDSTEIELHHVKLMEVGNLPAGITWQSNTIDSIFTAGEYYCVLMEGAPVLAGDYPLRIVVDVYVVVVPGWPPIKVATVTDSTSLTLVVVDDAGIKGNENTSLFVRQNIPNPFQCNTRIDFHSEIIGTVDFEVYSILGQRVYDQQIIAIRGENSLIFNGQMLPEGPYFYIFRSARYKSTGIMIRKD